KAKTPKRISHMNTEELFHVAVAQVRPAATSEQAVDRIEEYAALATEQKAKLLLFPEAFVGGYPRGSSFGSSVGERTQEGRDEFRRYWEDAVEIPGNECDRLASIAHDARMQLVVGVIERDGGTLYCSVVFFSAEGELMGKHRKL